MKTLILFLIYIVPFVLGQNSSSCRGVNDQCLAVFTHTPKNYPKCYCTSVCSKSIEDLQKECISGEAHWDSCGICLVCAKSKGESCGGPHNSGGVCTGGLTCLIDIPRFTNLAEKMKGEQNAIGKCIESSSVLCPKSERPNNPKNVNCRPGRVGILLDALYCPTLSQNPSFTNPSKTLSSSSQKLPTFSSIATQGSSVNQGTLSSPLGSFASPQGSSPQGSFSSSPQGSFSSSSQGSFLSSPQGSFLSSPQGSFPSSSQGSFLSSSQGPIPLQGSLFAQSAFPPSNSFQSQGPFSQINSFPPQVPFLNTNNPNIQFF